MAKLLISTALLFACAVIASGQVKYSIYHNDRYSFSIEYPSSLLEMQQPEQAKDVGKDFRSKDGKVQMMVVATVNESGLSAKEWAHLHVYRNELHNHKYTEVAPAGFVLTGMVKNRIYFEKTLHHKFSRAEIYYTFFIKYPKSARKKWEPIIKRIAESFKFDG